MLTPLALILLFFFFSFFGVVCMFYHSLRVQEKALQALMREQQTMCDALEHVLLLLTRQGAFGQGDYDGDDPAPGPYPAQNEEIEQALPPLGSDDMDAALVQATAHSLDDVPLTLKPGGIPMPKPGGPDRLEL